MKALGYALLAGVVLGAALVITAAEWYVSHERGRDREYPKPAPSGGGGGTVGNSGKVETS
jgi:hypothetical protein